MQPLPLKLIEAGMVAAGVVGVLILVAPNFGRKPQTTADGWRFPVKPTCLLLYFLTLTGGMTAVAYSGWQLLNRGAGNWTGWIGFAFGFFLVPLVLADWPEPLLLDCDGLVEAGSEHSRIRWHDLEYIRAYRIRCDRGIIVQGRDGEHLLIADIAYDTGALLDRLLEIHPVPYYAEQGEAVSLLRDRHIQP